MTEGIIFATPCYGNMVTAAYTRSALVTMEELTRAGIPNDFIIPENNDSLVHRGRMKIAAKFLRDTEFSHFFWIDADIEFGPEDVAKLWNLNADIGVGVYAMKRPDKQWFAAWKDGQLVKNLDQFNGPIEVDYAGTGFMLIKREALERIYAHLREKSGRVRQIIDVARSYLADSLRDDTNALMKEITDAFSPDFEEDIGDGGPPVKVPALYMTPIFNGGLESEDYNFCRVAREAGLKVVMDPSIRLKHWGSYPYGQ